MKSEKEMVLDYASELKMLAVRDILDEINATAVKENWSYMRMLVISKFKSINFS